MWLAIALGLLPAVVAHAADNRTSWMVMQQTRACDGDEQRTVKQWGAKKARAAFSVYEIWGHHGVSQGMRGDIGINVTRLSDGYVLARFRLDRYAEETRIIQVRPVIGPPIILEPGEQIEVVTHCLQFNRDTVGQAYITFAVWLDGMSVTQAGAP